MKEVAVVVNNNRSYRSTRCNSAPQKPGNSTLKKLQAIDMALVETALYLDSYPENKAALAYYSKLVDEHDRLSALMTREGRPMTQHASGKGESWNWVSSPWPWEIEANL